MSNALSAHHYNDLLELADDLYRRLDGHIIMGIPIGIGKATQLVNALYHQAKQNPNYRLDIHTALSLSRPELKTDLEKRLLEPFFDRQFKDVPELDYTKDAKHNCLPDNVNIIEFYFKPGEMLHAAKSQQNVLSANYTHVARDIVDRQVNLVTQMISKKQIDGVWRYSLSSNPDVTLDLQRLMRKKNTEDGKTRLLIAQVNTELPFMPNDAEIEPDFFDYIHDDPKLYSPLFCTPHQPISPVDHMIGFYTSALVKDGGTLQIGIGSLGDAVVNALLVRHNQNAYYRQLLENTDASEKFPILNSEGGFAPFTTGLYGNTEMLVPGYIELIKGGVLKRRVYDDLAIQKCVNSGLNPEKLSIEWITALQKLGAIQSTLTQTDINYLKHWGLLKSDVTMEHGKLRRGENTNSTAQLNTETLKWIESHALGSLIQHPTLIHAGFFVGNHHFYQDLHQMPADQLAQFNMTSVNFTNQLHGDELLKLEQRHHARFINACMKMTLSGAAVSDGLADGKVVSGVGGQFNFVSMAHDIPNARSILMMRASRKKANKLISNIVFNYGHITIPRHMRDVVITEYGIADLRGKNDQEIIHELLKVSDSRFQTSLIKQAQRTGKLPLDYQLPESALNNTPEAISNIMAATGQQLFRTFPFGKELTDEEVVIGGALRRLQANLSKVWPLLPAILLPASKRKIEDNRRYLTRMRLDTVHSPKEWLFRKLLLSVLPTASKR